MTNPYAHDPDCDFWFDHYEQEVSDAATGPLHFPLECKLHNGFPSDDEIAVGVPIAEQGGW